MNNTRNFRARTHYCAACNKWLTKLHWVRHLKSKFHQRKEKTFFKINFAKETYSSASNQPEKQPKYTPEKNQPVQEQYQITGSTLKKCRCNHNSIQTEYPQTLAHDDWNLEEPQFQLFDLLQQDNNQSTTETCADTHFDMLSYFRCRLCNPDHYHLYQDITHNGMLVVK